MDRLRPLMIAGTGSNVGKSIITAGLCRIFLQDGYNPAPFKAQNMALNSFVTIDGLEIGRAQAVQAEAAGIECMAEMNPLLLKPTDDKTSQVIVLGRPIGHQRATELFRKEGRDKLRIIVNNAFHKLSSSYNPIVMEGAGSISELNLQDVDLVNMPMAREGDAAVILVCDIDKGGVFASVFGSIMLQNEEDRKRIKGIIINKFRGDISLFDPGIKILERICNNIPVLGVIPYYHDIKIDEEDSLPSYLKNRFFQKGKVNICVVHIPHMSNFTDFTYLERLPGINLFFTNDPKELSKADFIILPGTKSTIADMSYLFDSGLADVVVSKAKEGTKVLGICGGYQILGEKIYDPDSIEGTKKEINGLGLLHSTTTITPKKKTSRIKFQISDTKTWNQGYEIHMGITEPINSYTMNSFITLEDGKSGGYYNGNVFGSYIHGLLDNREVINYFLSYKGYTVPQNTLSLKDYKEMQYNLFASRLRTNLKMDVLYEILKN